MRTTTLHLASLRRNGRTEFYGSTDNTLFYRLYKREVDPAQIIQIISSGQAKRAPRPRLLRDRLARNGAHFAAVTHDHRGRNPTLTLMEGTPK